MQTDSNWHAADVILRSSDAKMFYSWKTLLSISSPVFNDMFSISQPDTANSDNVDDDCHWHDGLPVIDLTEDSCTLSNILSLCHPPSCTGEQLKLDSIRKLQDVLETAEKYHMEILHCVALKELSNPTFLHKDPLRIYALACQHGCNEAAELAAKRTLAFSLSTLMQEDVPELENVHAGKLWRLFCYREASVKVACSVANDHTWIVHTRFLPLFQCEGNEREWATVRYPPSRKYPTGRTGAMPVHTWWLEYMRKSESALQRSPHGNSVKDAGLVDDALLAISSSACKKCNTCLVSETFRSFVDSFAEHIEHRVAEVKIHLWV